MLLEHFALPLSLYTTGSVLKYHLARMSDALALLRRIKAERAADKVAHVENKENTSEPSSLERVPSVDSTAVIDRLELTIDSIDRYIVPLNRVYYVNRALQDQHCSTLLSCIDEAPAACWVSLRRRRLQNWGGTVTPHGLDCVAALPLWLDRLAGLLVDAGIFPCKSLVALNRAFL